MTTMGNHERGCPEGGLGLLFMGSPHNHVHFHQDEHQKWYQHHHHHPHNTWFPTTSTSSSRTRPAINPSATVNSTLTSTTFPHIPSSLSPRFGSNVFPTMPTLTIPAMRKQIHSSPQSPFENGHLRPYNPPCSAPAHLVPHPWRASKGRSREIKGLCCFFIYLLIPFCSPIVVFFFILSFTMVAHLSIFFHLRNTKRFQITRQQHLYTPVACFSSTSNAISPRLSAELRPLDPTISDNDKDDSHRSWARTGCIVSLMR